MTTEMFGHKSRTLALLCTAHDHPRSLGALRSFILSPESSSTVYWGVDGPYVEHQVGPQAAIGGTPFVETRLGRSLISRGSTMHERIKIVCPACGDDLTLGDSFGRGRRFDPTGVTVQQAFTEAERARAAGDAERRFAAHQRLSVLADSGESCLSLTMLRAILAMR